MSMTSIVKGMGTERVAASTHRLSFGIWLFAVPVIGVLYASQAHASVEKEIQYMLNSFSF